MRRAREKGLKKLFTLTSFLREVRISRAEVLYEQAYPVVLIVVGRFRKFPETGHLPPGQALEQLYEFMFMHALKVKNPKNAGCLFC